MVTNQETRSPAFAGTKKSQALANKAFDVLRSRGMFMSDYSPIRVPAEALTAFLVEREGAKAADVASAIRDNPDVFSTVSVDGID
jgi:predicted ATPase